MLQVKLESEKERFKINKIKQSIQAREDNLKTNQTKLLNSLLDRKSKKITLDIYEEVNGELIFTIDKDEIEKQ